MSTTGSRNKSGDVLNGIKLDENSDLGRVILAKPGIRDKIEKVLSESGYVLYHVHPTEETNQAETALKIKEITI